jgi:hypothetical protein
MICTEEDNFTIERMRWLADLSDGRTVLQDDGRPGLEPYQAWLRLKEFCRQTGISVVNLRLQFRSHIEAPLPDNAPAYFFSHKAGALMSSGEPTHTDLFYLIGYLIPEKEAVYIEHYLAPAIILVETETRPLTSISNKNLIWKDESERQLDSDLDRQAVLVS